MTLIDHLADSLDRLPDGALVVGYSGGLDSTVLLHALASLDAAHARGLRALHVDHGLHADSGDWTQHCRTVCAGLDVELDVIAVQVDLTGGGPEAAARRARWQAFAQNIAIGRERLVLAQHRDDQAETLMLRLLRGAGPAGLAAMRTYSTRASGLTVWRPLLDIGRDALAEYANDAGLRWIDDPSNLDVRFDRNFLRHRILPALRERWPALDATLTQVARRQADAQVLETHVATGLLAQAATLDPQVLDATTLRASLRPLRWAALRQWLSQHGAGDLGADTLARIDTELIDAAEDAEPRIDLGGCILRRYRHELHALAPGADLPLDYRLPWDGRTPLSLPAGSGRLEIDSPAPLPALPLSVASRTGGERIRMHSDRPRQSLKHLLQDAGVPPWQRSRWPVIWLDGEPVAFSDIIVGATLSERLAASQARLRFIAD